MRRDRSPRRVIVGLFAVGLAAACAGPGSGGKVIVLGIDGLEPTVVDLLMSEGKMPNFARLRREGASGRLTSSPPLLSPIIWTTIATGKDPAEHNIGHFVAVNQATGETLPVTSQMRRVKALWNIASAAERRAVVVGWWATWPAEVVDGAVVSDHTCYHFLFDEGATGAAESTGVVYPPDLTSTVMSLVRRPGDLRHAEVARFVTVSEDEFARPFDFKNELSEFKWALATAQSYTAIGEALWKKLQPDLLMVYVEGVDSSSHLFGHLFRSQDLAGELAEQQRRYGRAVEEMYRYADEIVGRYLALLDADSTLLVLSDHGFELGALHGDPSKTRDMRRVSERFHRIEGVVYLYGHGIKPASRLERPVLLDVAPTVLSLLGLAPARDMRGRVLAEAMTIAAVPAAVATYETAGDGAVAQQEVAPVDAAIVERLKSLGYLDTQSAPGQRNLASMHFEAGRYEEAATIYRELVAKQPDDGALRASLAGALGALGRYDEALAQLREAERLAPLSPEPHHNRGVIYERQQKRDDAVEQYRAALRYNSEYGPARAALERLTGSPEVTTTRTAAERLAGAMAERASQAARRGDYAAAMKTLDEAIRVAPGYALIFQYRANVAFLMGDRDGAIASLKRALEIEPDNVLYRRNLATLEETAK